MFANRVLALLVSVWFGAYVLAGYGVAPLLFQSLPKEQAGTLAGVLFSTVNYIGLFVWAVVYLAGVSARRQSFGRGGNSKLSSRLVAFTWLLLAVSQFVLVPLIRALRTGQTHWLSNLLGGEMGFWHGMSSSLYMLVSLLGLVLLMRLVRFEWH
ncbi:MULTISPECIES: DUF4149 domain-containing protein [Eikenella]|uniref:TMEM205-like domain-containing protein n=1 Tax=Eikenella longinqua TaxID=1795827 RepID=A0A1A9RXI2_9NEIS|nr:MULTISPECIES: DUF4149 domain-containing protein [Eikenella]OAM29154.1 hypothetical protein A7P95_04165 [Eikenella longinqua]